MDEQSPVAAYRGRAHEAIRAAQDALSQRHLETAISRAYYACYYTIHAQLEALGEEAGSHKQTGILFRKYFIRTNLIDQKYSTIFRELSEWRMEADCAPTPEVNRQMATDLVVKASRFVEDLLAIKARRVK